VQNTESQFACHFSVPTGVPQGSILSPHLFNVFINDIPLSDKYELAMYADDTAIICEVPWRHSKLLTKKLTSALENVSDFFNSWRIRLNPEKTEFIVFSKSLKMIRTLNKTPVIFRNNTFNWKPFVKYLGVLLDQKLLFKQHIEWVVKKASNMIRTLYPLLKRNNKAKIKSKIHAYRAIIRPIMVYACPIFANCAERHFQRLQIQQNKILRMALNADFFTRISALHGAARIPTIREHVAKLTLDFYDRARSHKNHLVSSLGAYNRDSLSFRVKHRLPRSLS